MTPNELSRRQFLRKSGSVAAGLAAAHVLAQNAGVSTAQAAAASGNEICRMDAVSLARAIRSKQLSPIEVIDAVLVRMDKLEPTLHAFCTPTPEVARETAKRIEADIMAGRAVGPLAGVPIGIKDLVYTKGIKTTSGSIVYKDYVPTEDDVVVERLKAAGAVILGKTNVPEFGMGSHTYNSVYGTTVNPYDVTKSAGGSSGGAGAALAAGLLPLADGSDLGGSLRNPANFNNIVALRPTSGISPALGDETSLGLHV